MQRASFKGTLQSQSLQNGLRLAEGADDSRGRGQGRELDERWRHEYAVRQRALRVLEHIDDFDGVLVLQVGLAERSKVGHGLRGVLCVARDIESELEL